MFLQILWLHIPLTDLIEPFILVTLLHSFQIPLDPCLPSHLHSALMIAVICSLFAQKPDENYHCACLRKGQSVPVPLSGLRCAMPQAQDQRAEAWAESKGSRLRVLVRWTSDGPEASAAALRSIHTLRSSGPGVSNSFSYFALSDLLFMWVKRCHNVCAFTCVCMHGHTLTCISNYEHLHGMNVN